MKTSFTLTVNDFGRLQLVILGRVRKKLGFFSVYSVLDTLIFFCIGFAGAQYVQLVRENPHIAEPLKLIAFLVVFALLALFLSRAIFRKHMLAPNGAFLSLQTVELTENSVLVSSVTGNIEIFWSAVLARDEDDKNYYLFIEVMQALVLPKSADASFIVEFEKYTAHLNDVQKSAL